MIIKYFEVDFDGVKSSISLIPRSEGLNENIIERYQVLKSCAVIPETGEDNIMDILVDFLFQTETTSLFYSKNGVKVAKYTLDFVVKNKKWHIFVEYTEMGLKTQKMTVDGKEQLKSIRDILPTLFEHWHYVYGVNRVEMDISYISRLGNKLIFIKWIDYARHPKLLMDFLEKYHRLCNNQLIFSTYNIKIMDRRIMRDEQIVIVQNGKTSSLADYEIDDKYIILDNLYLQGAFV